MAEGQRFKIEFVSPLHRMHMCKYLLFQLQQHLGNPRLISQLFLSYNFLAHSIPATCLQHTHFLQPGLGTALLRFRLTLFDQLKKTHGVQFDQAQGTAVLYS